MMTDEEFEFYRGNYAALSEFAERYRADAALRGRLAAGDGSEVPLEIPPGMEIRVAEQSPDVYYVAMPADPNAAMSDQMLESVSGGIQVGTLSSVGTTSTASSVPSTLSTTGSFGSLASATQG